MKTNRTGGSGSPKSEKIPYHQTRAGRGGADDAPVVIQRVIGDDGSEKLEVLLPSGMDGQGKRMLYDPANVSGWGLRVAVAAGVQDDSPLVWARLTALEESIRPVPREDVIEECQALVADLWDGKDAPLYSQLVTRLEKAAAMLNGHVLRQGRPSPKEHVAQFIKETRQACEALRPRLVGKGGHHDV